MWVDYMVEDNVRLKQLAVLLLKVTVSGGAIEHKDYEPVYIFRVCVNKLNEMGEKMLTTKRMGTIAMKQ